MWNIELLEPSLAPWEHEAEPAKQIAVLYNSNDNIVAGGIISAEIVI